MNSAIFNRFNPDANGWITIAVSGEHPHSAGIQLVDVDALHRLVANHDGRPLLVDADHESHDTTKSTAALGWVEELRVANDALQGRVRWTARGEEAVTNGDFRFTSPVWEVERDAQDRMIPVRLLDVALTNQPNIKGMPPISNRKTLPGDPASDPAIGNKKADNQIKNMKQVATKLGLSADASEDAVLAEVIKLMNRADTAEQKLGPVTTERDDLKNRVSTLLNEQIESDLDATGIKDEAVRVKLRPVLAPMKNREERTEFLSLILAGKDDDTKGATQSITNRSTAKTPDGSKKSADSDEELARKAESEIQNYRLANRCSYGDARNAVRAQKPELFGLTK